MIRKKIEFLMKPIPRKTYEIGDTVTVLWNYLPETCKHDYRFTLNKYMLYKFGGKRFRIRGKSIAIISVTNGNRPFTSIDDCTVYYLENGAEEGLGYMFSSDMFKESYRYDKKKD